MCSLITKKFVKKAPTRGASVGEGGEDQNKFDEEKRGKSLTHELTATFTDDD